MFIHRNALAAFIALSAIVAPSETSADILMSFPQAETLKGQMLVSSYSWQRAAPPLARICTGAGAGGRFTILKPVDDSSPALAETLKTKNGAVVQLDDAKADGKRMAFQFTNAVIGAIKPVTEDGKQMESIEFNYSAIQWLTVGCDPPPASRAQVETVPDLPMAAVAAVTAAVAAVAVAATVTSCSTSRTQF